MEEKLCEMTTSQCAYLVSTRKGYAGVHQCQGEGKKVTHTLIQALLMLVSCTLKTSQVELPLHFLNWCFFGWQKGERGGSIERSRAKISMEALNFRLVPTRTDTLFLEVCLTKK